MPSGCRAALVLVLATALGAVGCGQARPRAQPDGGCLARLRAAGVRFAEGPSAKGLRTPVTIDGDAFAVRLRPRGARPAHMDCQLAVGLAAAAPIFARHGIDELEYSAAYHYRNRRGSDRLSAHAAGLAIDVHVLHGPRGAYVIAGNFERGVGRWRDLRVQPGAYRACVGQPRTAKGRTLRQLACRLKLHDAFRVIITPDDDRDHRDHLHLEVYEDAAARLGERP